MKHTRILLLAGFLSVISSLVFAEDNATYTITSTEWTMVKPKGVAVTDWQVPSQEEIGSLLNISNDIHRRPGKTGRLEDKFNVVRARFPGCPPLKVETGSYPRKVYMELPGRYAWGILEANEPGIVEAQASYVQMFLRLSEDNNWVFVMMRRFHREYTVVHCVNKMTPDWLVRNDYTMPLPRYFFTKETIKEVCKEVERIVEHEKPCPPVEQPRQMVCPPPVIVVPWNGSYHSQPGYVIHQDILNGWQTQFRSTTNWKSTPCPTIIPPPPPIWCPGPPPIPNDGGVGPQPFKPGK